LNSACTRSALSDARSLGQAHVHWLDDLSEDGTACFLPPGRKTVVEHRPGHVVVEHRPGYVGAERHLGYVGMEHHPGYVGVVRVAD